MNGHREFLKSNEFVHVFQQQQHLSPPDLLLQQVSAIIRREKKLSAIQKLICLSLCLCVYVSISFCLCIPQHMDENDRPLLLSFESRLTCSPSMAVWLSGSLRKNCFTSPSTKAIMVEASTTEVTSLDNNMLGVATLVLEFVLLKEENRALK